tara:strand:+ start:7985 stop:8965 length:981 start_codon:yes stop_codon:yes gene_type:complete
MQLINLISTIHDFISHAVVPKKKNNNPVVPPSDKFKEYEYKKYKDEKKALNEIDNVYKSLPLIVIENLGNGMLVIVYYIFALSVIFIYFGIIFSFLWFFVLIPTNFLTINKNNSKGWYAHYLGFIWKFINFYAKKIHPYFLILSLLLFVASGVLVLVLYLLYQTTDKFPFSMLNPIWEEMKIFEGSESSFEFIENVGKCLSSNKGSNILTCEKKSANVLFKNFILNAYKNGADNYDDDIIKLLNTNLVIKKKDETIESFTNYKKKKIYDTFADMDKNQLSNKMNMFKEKVNDFKEIYEKQKAKLNESIEKANQDEIDSKKEKKEKK